MSENIQTKKCSTCKQIKEIDKFCKAKNRKDGYHNQCKICKNKSHRQYKRTIKGKLVQKRYYNSTKGKATHTKYKIKYHADYPERDKAVSAVNHAIRDGKFGHIYVLMKSLSEIYSFFRHAH